MCFYQTSRLCSKMVWFFPTRKALKHLKASQLSMSSCFTFSWPRRAVQVACSWCWWKALNRSNLATGYLQLVDHKADHATYSAGCCVFPIVFKLNCLINIYAILVCSTSDSESKKDMNENNKLTGVDCKLTENDWTRSIAPAQLFASVCAWSSPWNWAPCTTSVVSLLSMSDFGLQKHPGRNHMLCSSHARRRTSAMASPRPKIQLPKIAEIMLTLESRLVEIS